MPYAGLLDVASDAEDFDAVEVVEVVFEVELVEVEWGDEGCVVGRGEGCAEEGEREIRSSAEENHFQYSRKRTSGVGGKGVMD